MIVSNPASSPTPYPTATVFPTPLTLKEIEQAHQEYIDKLTQGEFFSNVPDEMEVGQEVIIEAGLAERDAAQVAEKLGVEGNVQIRQDVRYDPLRTRLELILDKDAFKVTNISTGAKPVLSGSESLWRWKIKPLKEGEYTVIIQAVVTISSNGLEPYSKDFLTFEEKRLVKAVEVPFSSKARQFFANNWNTILGRVIGPASISGLVAWLISYRREKAKQKQEKEERPLILPENRKRKRGP